MEKTVYVGLDVHADTIAVALANEGRVGEMRFYGTIANSADTVLRLTKTLSRDGQIPTFCYEAGPCGYGLHRHLTRLGFECAVVAPALIPRKMGDRIKTDRRDAEMVARLWRAGELTPIWTPDEEQEAMRDLIRTRKQTVDALKVAKQQLLSFLLRHGLRYTNGSYWTKRHRRPSRFWGWPNCASFHIRISRSPLRSLNVPSIRSRRASQHWISQLKRPSRAGISPRSWMHFGRCAA